jgi:hypothetical protein
MRFQEGMAVGHTYMHGMLAKVPTIPGDFDHHLEFPEEEGGLGEGEDYVYPESDSEDGSDGE